MLDPATGFSTTLEFPDPARQHASAPHASGVPIGTPSKGWPFARMGTFIPNVIVRNLLGSSQTVTITLEYPDGQGTEQAVLAPVPVGAYSTQDFSFASVLGRLPLPLPYASIRIQYSGPPGSAITEVSSVEQRHDLVIDSRVANEGDGWAGSGAHPWHLDNETESVLFLTNMGETEAPIGFHILANGTHYYLTDLKLNPHETRAIDLRKLRDAQRSDFRRNTIPANAADGSVLWIRLDDVPVMGRLVVVQRHKGLASNYDCNTCPCPPSYRSLTTAPDPISLPPNTTMDCSCTEHKTDCNGLDWPAYVTTSATWSSDNTSIVYMDSTVKGRVHGVKVGNAQIKTSFTGQVWSWNYTTHSCENVANPTYSSTDECYVTDKCGDQRDTITQEYVTYGVELYPTCADFTQTAHSYYFTFAQLNTGDYAWALVKKPMTAASSSGYGLDDWRVQYGASRIINSAYRNPAHNANLNPPGAAQSRHMYGDAADLRSQSYSSSCGAGSACLAEWNAMITAVGSASQQTGARADYTEPSTLACGYACAHADWRAHDLGIYSQ